MAGESAVIRSPRSFGAQVAFRDVVQGLEYFTVLMLLVIRKSCHNILASLSLVAGRSSR